MTQSRDSGVLEQRNEIGQPLAEGLGIGRVISETSGVSWSAAAAATKQRRIVVMGSGMESCRPIPVDNKKSRPEEERLPVLASGRRRFYYPKRNGSTTTNDLTTSPFKNQPKKKKPSTERHLSGYEPPLAGRVGRVMEHSTVSLLAHSTRSRSITTS